MAKVIFLGFLTACAGACTIVAPLPLAFFSGAGAICLLAATVTA